MKLFVFDIDDTISETALIHQWFFIEALREMGVQEMNTDFGGYKHHTDSFIAKQIYEKNSTRVFNDDRLKEYEDKVLEKLLQIEIKEIKGAVQFLKELKERGDIAIAFATGAVRRTAEYKLEKLGIPFVSEQLVASNKIEDREGIVAQAIENAKRLNEVEEFDEIFSFGDGIWDFKTAQNLDLTFVGIGKRNKSALLEAGTEFYFDDFQQDVVLKKMLK